MLCILYNACLGKKSIPVAQKIEHGASIVKFMGLIPWECRECGQNDTLWLVGRKSNFIYFDSMHWQIF